TFPLSACKELENSPDIQIITDGEHHSLIIAEAFEEDTGRYSCFASNFYGTDSTSAEIYVEGRFYSSVPAPSSTQQTETAASNPLPLDPVVSSVLTVQSPVAQSQQSEYLITAEKIAILIFPFQSLQDIFVSEGQLVVLECRVKGSPSPKVDWCREGKLIEDSPEFRILQKKPRSPAEPEEICTLVIAEVFSEDAGMFTCTANNMIGTVSSSAALRVRVGSTNTSAKVKVTPNKQNGSPVVVPLPDPPANSCLKTGSLSNHRDSRSGSRVGLRVHFKLPEEEEEGEESDSFTQGDDDASRALANKEPPPVLAKPKLDPAQLQLLHNQVLMEQQQEAEPQTQTQPPPQPQPQPQPQSQPLPQPSFQNTSQPKIQTSNEGPLWSPRVSRETRLPPFPSHITTTAPLQQTPYTAPPFTTTPHTSQLSSPPSFNSTFSPLNNTPPAPAFTSAPPSIPQLQTSSLMTSPPPAPQLISTQPPPPPSFPNNTFAVRAQSPPQASSPTSSSSTPSPIQNPVAFLSSVLPSLTPSQPTNSMGLPKGAPSGFQKKMVHGAAGTDSTCGVVVIFFSLQEYKVSNFEQRLMSEIEFRLERTPVEESDDEIQHDDVPSGKCIAPIFDKKLKNYKAMEGVPVTFSCKVLGIPPPKVYWFKDGKQILRRNLHYKKIREGDGTCSLHIEVTTSDDDGNYTVMAANPQGRISCSGHLIIQTGPPRNRLAPIHPLRVRARIQEVEGEPTQERFFQPHFLQAPGDSLAHEGKLCRLDCKVSGLPNPELMWLVNGRPIYPDLYHRLLVRENGVHSLVIDPVKKNDGGTYTCIASNKAGQSSFSLDLKVVAKEMKHPPQFVEKLQNMGIPERTPVRLECRVVGMPPPVIFWKKDNDSIPKTKDRFSMTQDATGYVCLLIQPTTKDDAGWYTVSAKNEAGIVSSTCRLDIYAQWHQSIPAPMKTTQRTGSRYAALTVQGLDIKSAFPTSETSPILFSSSPPEAMLESEEL
uniref:Myopalladin n=1 Tax=Cynoglossus semilaevis TaxID=244447 RepID=A0A3P8VMS1_CYNSE